MKVVNRKLLEEFASGHADIRSNLDSWLAEVQEANWGTSMDIKSRFPTASFLADNRVVFNIKGNKYRLDAKIAYKTGVVFIKRTGTHDEYSKWEF